MSDGRANNNVIFLTPPSEVLTLDDLKFAVSSRTPIWLFDIDNNRVTWANEPALTVWRAPTLAALKGRDLAADMSPTVQARLLQFLTGFWRGEIFDEIWTIYPNNRPTTLACRIRGCLLPNGTMAMLCEAQALADDPPELTRAAQALIYTGLSVSSYDESGRCLYANPAARRSFAPDAMNIKERILSSDLRDKLLGGINSGGECKVLSKVKTASGIRLHEIDVKVGSDAKTGEKTWILTEYDVTQAEKAKQDTLYLANHDPLTHLKNRTFLNLHAEEFIEKTAAQGYSVYMYLIDLDRFKYINDTLGHTAGDQLLFEIATRLKKTVPNGSIIARLGGDEFCLLLKNDQSLVVNNLCCDLFRELGKPFNIMGHSLRLNASIGTGETNPSDLSFEMLLQKADLALYAAKRKGGNNCETFHQEMAEASRKFLDIDNQIETALRENLFQLCFQPKISLTTDKIVGIEALCRLNLSSGEILLPDDFIPIAETTGSIIKLGSWAMNEAAKISSALRDKGLMVPISVNVSPAQFKTDEFIQLLRKLHSEPDFAPEMIELEITESLLLTEDNQFQEALIEISKMGFGIAVDDFGTAYSNISSLQHFPIDCLKIDRSLLADEKFKVLAVTVISMAQALNIRVVAEGVENEEQKRWLKEAGCDQYQGFYFSRPLFFDELCEFLEAQK